VLELRGKIHGSLFSVYQTSLRYFMRSNFGSPSGRRVMRNAVW
jgi:hypothetical protein